MCAAYARGYAYKIAILNTAQRDDPAHSSHVIGQKPSDLLPIIKANVATCTDVIKDEDGQCRLKKHFTKPDSFVTATPHTVATYTNTGKGFYSVSKRSMMGFDQHCGAPPVSIRRESASTTSSAQKPIMMRLLANVCHTARL